MPPKAVVDDDSGFGEVATAKRPPEDVDQLLPVNEGPGETGVSQMTLELGLKRHVLAP